MTLDIALSNEQEAVVITDRRIVEKGSSDDNVRKFEFYHDDNYRGVLFWAGPRGIATSTIRLAKLRRIWEQNKSNKGFVLSFGTILTEVLNGDAETYRAPFLSRIHADAKSVEASKRQKYIDRRTGQLMRESDQRRNYRTPVFGFCAYDHSECLIKIRGLDRETYVTAPGQLEMGIASGLANAYLKTEGTIKDPTSLSLVELVHGGLCSFVNSLSQQDVGGTPDIFIVNKDGVDHYCDIKDDETTRGAIPNIGLAHVVRLTPAIADQRVCMGLMNACLKRKGDYKAAVETALQTPWYNLVAGMDSLTKMRERAAYFEKHSDDLIDVNRDTVRFIEKYGCLFGFS